MRHIGSLLLAAVFAPAIFLLTGTGLSAFSSARPQHFADDPIGTLAALGALVLAGVLYGILVMVRLSPIGPGLAGIALVAASSWALVAPESYDDSFAMLDVHMGGAVGQWGLGILLGMPLLATLASGQRWRREPATAAVTPEQTPEQPAPSVLPDATRPLPVQAEYLTLPDIAAPSLRYPTAPPPATAPPAATPPQPDNSADPTVVVKPARGALRAPLGGSRSATPPAAPPALPTPPAAETSAPAAPAQPYPPVPKPPADLGPAALPKRVPAPPPPGTAPADADIPLGPAMLPESFQGFTKKGDDAAAGDEPTEAK